MSFFTSKAHLFQSVALLLKISRQSRLQNVLRRTRRSPRLTDLRGAAFHWRIFHISCLNASDSKPLRVIFCTRM